MKKVLSIMLTFMLIITAIPMGAFTLTVSAATDGYYTYTVTDGKATITDVDDSISGDISIPDTLGGYIVTSIGRQAFYECESLTSITIPDSVISIGEYAFAWCDSLLSITIPDSVININGFAFFSCSSLATVIIGDGVTSVNQFLFAHCMNLTNLTIGDSVESIGDGAFYNCKSLKNVIIPDSVKSIGVTAFGSCQNLESVTLSSNTSIERVAFSNCEKISVVFFRGSAEEMIKYVADAENTGLTNVVWYHDSCIGASNHTYDNNCDAECNVCGNVRDIIGHRYDEHIIEATCTTDGYIVYYCVGCGDNYTVDLPANGHIYDDVFDVVCNKCKTERQYISGDTNGDGKLNGRDCSMILQYLNNWDVNIDMAAADVNNDHEINARDYSLLIRYLCGDDVELK